MAATTNAAHANQRRRTRPDGRIAPRSPSAALHEGHVGGDAKIAPRTSAWHRLQHGCVGDGAPIAQSAKHVALIAPRAVVAAMPMGRSTDSV
jgi:hypothetical protein